MKVKILKTGKTEEHAAAYAARLIEQGRATAAPAAKAKPAKPARHESAAPAPADEAKKE